MLYQMSYFRNFVCMKIIQTTNRVTLLNFCCGKVNLPIGEENQKLLFLAVLSALTVPVVGREGFEPSNSEEDRFTVCCRWPLGYLPYLFATLLKQ
jgi:hypothetical protein